MLRLQSSFVNAAFNISANAGVLYEKALGEMVPKVRHIGVPLNQRSEKALQLESSGGAR